MAIPLIVALIVLAAPVRAQAPASVDSPAAQAAGRDLAAQARAALAPLDDEEEAGPVTDEEASRPATPVSEGVYRSSRLNAAAIDRLYELGVRAVVNLESRKHFEEERRLLDEVQARRAAAGKPAWKIASISVPMSGIHPPGFWQVDAALNALADSSHRPVLVHCKHGEDRTGVVVSAFRLNVERKETLDEAVAEAKSFHCCHLVMPGEDGLRRFLQLYRWRP
jgi:protein tyrosine phosphatase (PTP) superfamily phosphohydrolase (DUF442 family)